MSNPQTKDVKEKKVRVFNLAKELNVESKLLLDYCKELGFSAITNQLNGLDPDQAEAILQRQVFDLCFLDLRLGEDNGLDVLAQMRVQAPWMRVVIVTAHSAVDTAVDAMQAGAADYLGKPHPRRVPEFLPRMLVGPVEAIAKLRGRQSPPFLTRAQIKFMTLNLDYSIAKAKRVLGYQPRVDFHDGIRTALDDLTGKATNREPQPVAAS